MIFYTLSGLINGLTATIVGFFVYTRNKKSIANIAFSLFCLCVAIWNYFYFAWLTISTSSREAIFWLTILLIGPIFIPGTFLHFTLEFLDLSKGWRKKTLIYGYIIDFVFLYFLLFSHLFLAGVTKRIYFEYFPYPGIVFHIFLFKFLMYSFYAHYLLYKAYRRAEGTRYYQLRLSFWGIIIGYIGGVPIWAIWYGSPIPPVTHILVSVYMTMLAYAIIFYKLFDIEVIIKKTLVFAGLLASVFAIFILPTWIIQDYLFRGAGTGGRMAGFALSAVILILTMRRIETFLINVTDKYLFQKKYDYKELLKTFTAEVLTVLELEKLVNLTVDKLTDIVKLASCAVLLFDEEKQEFAVTASKNVKDSEVKLIRPDGIVTFLEQTQGYLLVKELKQKRIFIPDSIQEIIDKLSAELIIPMVLHEEVMGILSMGKKKSDEEYTQDDLDILLPLAKTLAIAISNAKLFVELGKTQAEAAKAEKMAVIGTLSAGINHEICNPLGIARGQCEAFLLNLKDGLYKDKTLEELLTKAKDIMTKVIKETDRATAITKKLSTFAKPAKGEAELVNIELELEDVISLVGYELKLEKIEFDKRVDKNLPNILVDRKQFQEVLFNLIRNAGQAIGEKGKITLSARQEKARIFIEIQDTGSGIPEDKIKMLFNPFFTTKDPGKGTGLGLFIVRQVVEKNGGRIYLKETKAGEGTTFALEFPVAAAEKKEARAAA